MITRGEKVWSIEIKASRSVSAKDGRGLDRLADQCGKDFQGGCLLYDGWDVLPIGGSNHPAVPAGPSVCIGSSIFQKDTSLRADWGFRNDQLV